MSPGAWSLSIGLTVALIVAAVALAIALVRMASLASQVASWSSKWADEHVALNAHAQELEATEAERDRLKADVDRMSEIIARVTRERDEAKNHEILHASDTDLVDLGNHRLSPNGGGGPSGPGGGAHPATAAKPVPP